MSRESLPSLRAQREEEARRILTPISVGAVRDILIPTDEDRRIPIRIYHPFPSSPITPPILIFVHGGGWSLGSVNTYDSIARGFTNKIPAIVVSVEYRLAPEHPFPAGLEDIWTAIRWVAANAQKLGGDPTRIGIAGDSGGGSIATAIARRARRQRIDLRLQALFYPSTDIGGALAFPSYSQYGTGYLLPKSAIERFRVFYLPDKRDWLNIETSPLRASDYELSLLPPSLVVVAGCDPLRDEGIAYADRLGRCGVEVHLQTEPTMIHGFLGFYNSEPRASALVESIMDRTCTTIYNMFI